MLKQIIESDAAVKAIFDHFRNIGISGAVFATGAYALKHRQTDTFFQYAGWASGLALCVLGVLLLYIAERHGERKFSAALRNASVPMMLAARLLNGLTFFSLLFIATQKL